jgi:hypothetical protein
MGIVIAIIGAVVFTIGIVGAGILGIIEAFKVSFFSGLIVMTLVGMIIMIIGSIIDAEFN